jgi:hypothetical protein
MSVLFKPLRAIFFAVLLVVTAGAAERTVTFQPLKQDVVNPERGFYRFLKYFHEFTDADLAVQRQEGVSLVFAPVRLDDFRTRDLTPEFLSSFEQQFAKVQRAGLKVIFRVTYNFPDGEFDYLDAKDASLAQVKRHISQLAPVLEKNRDLIAVMQTGFIGAWGEGHTSSNQLDTPENKRAVIAELLAKLPESLQIQWRYPSDLIEWQDAKLEDVARVGLHNDCFMSSPTDVGTYDEDPDKRATQRARAAATSKNTFYVVETCAAQPKQVRKDCQSILREGPEFHVTSINREYNLAFINSWKKDGCYDEIEKSLGYRLRLVSASYDNDSGSFAITIMNDGWAKPMSSRALQVAWRDATGLEFTGALLIDVSADFAANKSTIVRGELAPAAQEVCISAPDTSPRLAADPRYAIRFANADDNANGQLWDGGKGRFCFKV